MLLSSPTSPIEMNHLTALFAYCPRAYIAAQARLVAALNPFAELPPDVAIFHSLVSGVIRLDDAANLNKLLVQVSMAPGKYQERTAAITANPTLSEYLRAASWFSLGVKTLPLKGYLFADPLLAPMLDRLSNLVTDVGASQKATVAGPTDASGKPTPQEKDWGFLTEAESSDLCLLTLAASFPKMMASFLTQEEDTPKGSPKDVYPVILRVSKLVALLVSLRQSIQAAHLYEMACFITSPLMQPFIPHFNPQVRDEVLNFCNKVKSLKLHPWIADAMAPGAAAVRPSPVGERTNTMGLADSGRAGSLWGKLSKWRRAVNDSAMDMRELILDKSEDGLIMSFHKEVDDFFLLRDAMHQDYVRQADALFGLKAPAPAVPVHLHGKTWRAIVMTGAEATEAISLHSLIMTPRYPAQDADGGTAHITGGVLNYEYEASGWAGASAGAATQFSGLQWMGYAPPLYVMPNRFKPLEGYGLGQILPEMIRPKTKTEFFGDDDADTFKNDIEAIASKLGYRSSAELVNAPNVRDRLSHLFTYDANAKPPWTRVVDCPYVFVSSRTQMPWRMRVTIPTAIPSQVMVMDAKTAPFSMRVNAVVVRTPDKPTMTHGTLAEADAMTLAAANGIGLTL